MGLSWEEATVIADECAKGGLVKHDLISPSTNYRHDRDLPHSVALDRKGWEMI
jgi:hypothetical protein